MEVFSRPHMRNVSPAPLTGRNMLWLLIGINVAMFFLATPGSKLWYSLSVTLNMANAYSFNPYQLFSSMFIHASFSHIFFNMFGLYIFGNLIADRVGFWKLLGLYLLSGLIGNLLFLIFYWSGNQPHVLMGASGAVYGIMAATAMIEPDRRFVIIFMPFTPVKTTTLVVVYTAIELLSQLTGASAGIAHLAHLGGFIGGYFYTSILLAKLARWHLRDLFKSKPASQQFTTNIVPPRTTKNINTDPNAPITQAELDFLLDKISSVGVNGLSEAELTRLRQAREQINRDRQSR